VSICIPFSTNPRPSPSLGVEEQIVGSPVELGLAHSAQKRIILVANTGWIKHIHRAQGCPVARGQAVQLPFDVIHHSRVGPGQELAGDMLAFAAASRAADKHIAQVVAFCARANPQDVAASIFRQEQVRPLERG
jgi:hypothetical protein